MPGTATAPRTARKAAPAKAGTATPGAKAKATPEKPSPLAAPKAKSPAPKRKTTTPGAGIRKAIQVAPEDRYRMICDAAYFIAEKRGFTPGDPQQDWLQAEAEIDRLLS